LNRGFRRERAAS